MGESSILRKIQHLHWRAGFGPHYSLLGKDNLSVNTEVNKLFKDAEVVKPISIGDQREIDYSEMKSLNGEKRRKLRRSFQKLVFDVTNKWMQQCVSDEHMLREKMTFFWSCHFACRIKDPWFAQNNNNIIREKALGKFGDLLTSVSKDAAMLLFLNNNQNRKQSPNENFAREVMELFTLGRGNYTEHDVKQGARAFTGWAFDKEGNFIFRDRAHDYDTKTFLGKIGNFNGDDILSIILEKKECAKFITRKIYRFFVNDEPDELIVNNLAENFYSSGYDIHKLMKEIFSSDWFYAEKNIGVKIKSPIELTAGLIRNFNLDFGNGMGMIVIQRLLGQELFRPPNVAGWAGGKDWINNSSLMVRLFLARKLINGDELALKPKDSFDVQEIQMDDQISFSGRNMEKNLIAESDMTGFINAFADMPQDKLNNMLLSFLIQADTSRISRDLFAEYNQSGNSENKIKNATLDLLSLPEYQLC